MKIIIGVTAILLCIYAKTHAATSFLDNISVSPYAAVQHQNITDGQNYGAGLDIGLGINKFVSIHALNTAYQTEDWGNSAIDETSLLGRFRLVHNASETLSLYGLAGGDRNWNTDSWAFGAGLGVELRVSKHVSLFGDSRIRAWFKDHNDTGAKDLQTRAGLQFSF